MGRRMLEKTPKISCGFTFVIAYEVAFVTPQISALTVKICEGAQYGSCVPQNGECTSRGDAPQIREVSFTRS